jgi:hypothetical protein
MKPLEVCKSCKRLMKRRNWITDAVEYRCVTKTSDRHKWAHSSLISARDKCEKFEASNA